MRRRFAAVVLLCACSAAEQAPKRAAEPAAKSATEVAPKSAASEGANEPQIATHAEPSRSFGAPLKSTAAAIPVEQVIAAPDALIGKAIACKGVVARVCQAAGCWLELQAQGASEGLRVPMANHAFFIPQDAVGHVAVIEGELKRRELPDAQRAHYQGEGMKAMGPLSLEATSVALW